MCCPPKSGPIVSDTRSSEVRTGNKGRSSAQGQGFESPIGTHWHRVNRQVRSNTGRFHRTMLLAGRMLVEHADTPACVRLRAVFESNARANWLDQ